MKKIKYFLVICILLLVCILDSETIYASKKTIVYAVMGNQIDTFKVSKGKLYLQSKDNIGYWDYGSGYDYFNTNELNTKKIQFKVSNNCKWTCSFAGDSDEVKRGYTNYKNVKAMVRNDSDEEDIGYMQLRVFVKNKKVIRVDVQTE